MKKKNINDKKNMASPYDLHALAQERKSEGHVKKHHADQSASPYDLNAIWEEME